MARKPAGSKARFQIRQGYIKFCHVDSKGRVISPMEFIEDAKNGHLYAVLDTKKDEIVTAKWTREGAEKEVERFGGGAA